MNELNWTQIVSSIDRPLVESDTHAEKCMESRQESNCLLIRHLVKREKKKQQSYAYMILDGIL